VELSGLDVKKKLDGYGVNIISVTDSAGNNLPYTINNTMMRIDLPKVLKVKVNWYLKLNGTIKFQNA